MAVKAAGKKPQKKNKSHGAKTEAGKKQNGGAAGRNQKHPEPGKRREKSSVRREEPMTGRRVPDGPIAGAGSAIRLTIKDRFAAQFKSGYPLLFKQALVHPELLKREGELLKLYDEQGRFLATAYSGKQNKGLGWIVDRKENTKLDKAFFTGVLAKAVSLRQPFYSSSDTTAFRVFNSEGDGIGGLIIDYYDGFYVLNWYSNGIYSFRTQIIEALQEVVSARGLYEKKRFDTAGKYIEDHDHLAGEVAPEPLIVKESSVNFAVYLNDGAMVGVFLDQREVRKTLRDRYAAGKTVLNTFSYTGAFSVFAALGGSSKTTSVDLANRSLPKTREQFLVNNVDPSAHEIVVEDVFHYFKYAVKKGLSFDVVILDPPSFAKSKKFTFAAEKDYVGLLKEAIAITAIGGVVLASTNCSSFDMAQFKEFVKTAFMEMGCRFAIEESFSLPPDFKTISAFEEGNYLKVLFIRRLT